MHADGVVLSCNVYYQEKHNQAMLNAKALIKNSHCSSVEKQSADYRRFLGQNAEFRRRHKDI